jgi:uncharacterized SAM-binding protein YcdF (DUF218 family)
MLRRLLEDCVLPPLSCLLLLLAGTVLRRWKPRLGRGVQVAACVLLWLLATPCIAGGLLRTLQQDPALPASGPLPKADAIVVLSAESDTRAPEYGSAVVGPLTLQRVRYAAFLHKRSGLPILTSGGRPTRDTRPLAAMMRDALVNEFGCQVRWVEDRSATTFENARFAAEMLRQDGVHRVFLVTHAWHMPRAEACFRAQGLEVVPAPTAFRGPAFENVFSLVPSWQALKDSSWALHEWCGRAWYGLAH